MHIHVGLLRMLSYINKHGTIKIYHRESVKNVCCHIVFDPALSNLISTEAVTVLV